MKWLSMTLVLALTAGAAQARVVIYTAKSGDTAETIAADYYGNRSQALFILETNGLQRDQAIRPGQLVRIPTAFHYRARRGDTFLLLAKRFLDDRRRAPFLAELNGMRAGDKLHEGVDLLIPFQHVHRAAAPESLQSVARLFYGDSAKAKMLASYNFRSTPLLAKGEHILVPIAHVKIRAVRLAQSRTAQVKEPATMAAAPPQEAQKREAELAARVGKQLAVAEQAYKDGSYSDVPAMLDKVLSQEDPSEQQLAELFRLKAYAYVALGLDELAVKAFREVLARDPQLSLDEATVSPKIRAALNRAQKAR